MKVMSKSALSGLGIASLLVLAGCAGAGEAEDTAPAETDETESSETTEEAPAEEAGSAFSQLDLSGISISVGSKDFDEQRILGYMLVEAFTEAGADVTDRVDLGGTAVAREALETGGSNGIDVYMEYNGTGWTNHLGKEDPSFDPDELTENVRAADLEENGIVWIGRSPFNNTYGFVSSPEITEANGGAFDLQGMMEYVRDNPDATVCMEQEYPSRPDGLILLTTATGIELPEAQRQSLDTGIIYTETAANNCDFGEVYTTDGRIPALGLTLVEDPGIHIIYNVSATMRQDMYEQAPEAFDEIINSILAPLDNDRMAAINARTSAEGIDPRQVARDYLVEEGLIAE